MIRHFEGLDPRRLKPNEHSETLDMGYVFADPAYVKFTQVGNDNDIVCIIVFQRYWENNYQAFFLLSRDYPVVMAKELKVFVDNAILDLGANRVQTDSVATPALDKWHEFLGFTCEGTREKMIFDKDYRCWARLRGRDF
jgi:hypothetical protein